MPSPTMCPGCRALLAEGDRSCPYCGWNVEQTAIRREGGPVDRALRPLGGLIPVLLFANVLLVVVAALVQVRMMNVARAGEAGGLGDLLSALWSPRTIVLVEMGANLPGRVLAGEPWLLLSCTFLHGGFWHIFFNMSALRNIGGVVEEAYGSGKALALYLLAGIAGSAGTVGWYWFQASGGGPAPRDIPSVGASGAIIGYAGLITALGFRIGGDRGKELWKPMVKAVGFILALGILLAFIPSPILLDNAAHGAGFLFGLGAGFLCTFGVRARGNPAAVRAWDAAAVVLSLLAVASFVPPGVALARALW